MAPLAWLPKRLGGFELNNVLAYTTSKQVTIHDRHLGCLYYSWVLLVISWIIGFQIMYGNNHYRLKDVRGSTRLTIQQPTKGCNPNKPDCEDDLTPLSELPYCRENKEGNHKKHRCIYADQHELLPGGMLEGKMFVPTRIDAMKEVQQCTPSASNGYKCDKMWKMIENKENTFVADIEDYTVMVVSSYARADLAGSSTDLQGFYYECRDKDTGKIIGTSKCSHEELKIRRIKCLPFLDCEYKSQSEPPRSPGFLKMRSRIGQFTIEADQDDSNKTAFKPGPVFAIPDGDIFKLSKLLELAGLDLDGSERNGETLRERGSRIKIQVEYANLYPWTGKTTAGYIYKVVEIPMEEMKTELYTHSQPADFPKTRTMENRHGIYLEAVVMGSFGFFDIVFLMVMLTTSMALLATGTTLIDLCADYTGLKVKSIKYEEVFHDGDNDAEDANADKQA